ncbi:DNA cytosine methyltransferase [Sphingomonas hankookensis]|uniref:DNA cytosine methyltransferase n=1 Tax=Sphingomonas hankookensis TaxID=563996 RepID=UPI003D302731
MRPLIIDNFAGGGGASTGLEAAFGRPVDVAVNHDEAAIAVHAANHPHTAHLCQSIMSIDPVDATGGAPVLLAWFSPDCKHHSKAKGGKPRDKNIRDLAHVVPHWIERLKRATPGGRGAPLVIMLENVEEFRQWGPLDADGKPIKERQGEEFRLWVARIRRQGYKVEWRELVAADYDGEVLQAAPTSRKRLFLIARRDGRPIVWPTPTRGKAGSPDVEAGKLLPRRTAAECIDWAIPCPSIFDRPRDLKPATCRRIAAGVMRYVVNSARPFIVPVTHAGGVRVHSIDDPFRTVTGAHRGELAVSVPHVMTMRNAGKPFTAIDEPTHTITAGGAHQNLVAANMLRLRRNAFGDDARAPLGTLTCGGHHGVVAGTLVSTDNTSTRATRAFDVQDPVRTITTSGGGYAQVAAFMAQHNTGVVGHPVDKPLSTIVQRGTQQQLVQTVLVEADSLPADMLDRAVQTAAFLVKYYGSEVGQHQSVERPIDTIPTKARFAVVTVTIDAATYVLVDIGMRMLTPPELAKAQGFPDGYILDPTCWYLTDNGNRRYGPLPKSHQIAKIGNSVCPNMSEVLARANLPEHCTGYVPDQVAA